MNIQKKNIFFFSDSSYGSVRASLVSENLSNDKEQLSSSSVVVTEEDKETTNSSIIKSSEIKAVRFEEVSTTNSPPSHVILKHRVNSSAESEIYSSSPAHIENNYSNNSYYSDYQIVSDDLSNWPYDLSRSSVNEIKSSSRNLIEFSTQQQQQHSPPLHHPTPAYQHLHSSSSSSNHNISHNNSVENSVEITTNLNYRNLYSSSPYIIANNMKGNLMTLSQFNDFLSPPSSVSSSSGYEFSDSNNNSFIHTNIDQVLPFHHNDFDADFRDDEFKTETCFLVEDMNTGSYTTLTNATVSNTPADLFHLHQTDYARSYFNNHSTSSGGESRSPDEYHNDDYDNGNGLNFTQLTNLTTATRTNGIYSSSPNHIGNDHAIISYDTSHVLSQAR